MTLVNLIIKLRLFLKEQLNIVVMGATAKGKLWFFERDIWIVLVAEERIFVHTNYFEELTNFFPTIKFKIHLVGLEMSSERHLKEHNISDNLSGTFFKGSISAFLDHHSYSPQDLSPLHSFLNPDSTFFISFNPGFGSGYDLLLNSWCVDLVTLLNANYPLVFT